MWLWISGVANALPLHPRYKRGREREKTIVLLNKYYFSISEISFHLYRTCSCVLILYI